MIIAQLNENNPEKCTGVARQKINTGLSHNWTKKHKKIQSGDAPQKNNIGTAEQKKHKKYKVVTGHKKIISAQLKEKMKKAQDWRAKKIKNGTTDLKKWKNEQW